jgi:hypothetical protein
MTYLKVVYACACNPPRKHLQADVTIVSFHRNFIRQGAVTSPLKSRVSIYCLSGFDLES